MQASSSGETLLNALRLCAARLRSSLAVNARNPGERSAACTTGIIPIRP